jgi:2-methylcitrate dehydratase
MALRAAVNKLLLETKAEKLAAWAASANFDKIDQTSLEQLKIRVLDSLGCAIAALDGEPIRPIRALTDELGGDGPCTLIGGGQAPLDRAAFYNGALVRYLDFMDFTCVTGETFHPSDNVAAVLAAAEQAGASGKEFLTALAVAYQVQTVLSEKSPLQERGFDHVTQLAYSITAGVSRALGLGAAETANALGINGCALNALWAVRTSRLSNWKGLASANTAKAATFGVLLAARGITGPLNVFEGPMGFEGSVGHSFDVDWRHQRFDAARRSAVKKYNAEAHSQSALEGVLELRAEHGVRADQVLRVELEVFKQLLNAIGGGEAGDKTIVESKEQADHSINYLVAVALLDGDVYPAQFKPPRIGARDVQDLLQKVWPRRSDELTHRYPAELPVHVAIVLKDGRVLLKDKRDFAGYPTRPLSWDGAVGKFSRLTQGFADDRLRSDIVDAVNRLDGIEIKELTELLGQVRRSA